ncbi:MAG: hypothetical protein AB1736_05650 [Chloroflexota bacterium]
MVAPVERLIRSLELCLDRGSQINSIAALREATLAEAQPYAPSTVLTIAFGLDTSAVFKLATDRANTDAVDYLAGKHVGPLVLPGQVVQEYWNNRINAIGTYGAIIRNKYLALAEEVGKIDPSYDPFHERFQALLGEFEAAYAFAFEPGTSARIATILETLQSKASVPYVPRARFLSIAAARDTTKTPPGFRDTGNGDFYVWADFLLGLLTAQQDGVQFHKAVLLAADEKDDWSRGGHAHPLLVAEVLALLNVPFETWNMVKLRKYVAFELTPAADRERRLAIQADKPAVAAAQPEGTA